DGARGTADVVLAEGEKDRRVSVVVALPEPSPLPAPPPLVTPPPPVGRLSGWKLAGYTSLGAGAVGLGAGAVFGALAIVKKGDAHCDAAGACSNGASLSDLRTASNVSTAGFVGGGALLLGGVAMLLLAPHSPADRPSVLHAAPLLGPQVAGLVVGGSFR
ncbi:MAG TPA: hypothetical protein VGI39_28000, partial [Polyangiaceae bacterium]